MISVCQADELPAMSFHVSTLVTSRMEMPRNADAVAFTSSTSLSTHSTSSSTNVATTTHSLRDIGPSLSSSSRAWAGAAGVALSPGG
jgi:hypothetical protein